MPHWQPDQAIVTNARKPGAPSGSEVVVGRFGLEHGGEERTHKRPAQMAYLYNVMKAILSQLTAITMINFCYGVVDWKVSWERFFKKD
ncbi:hypothetical protein [Paenibacillus sp. UNC451MF]|uniref:hypothetical protein n=1 Tax=Paenibacillus sp. UNC451MF TaxID=1449063 RepID=UPI00048B6640|nr:hypothetical protein [Paenibacillus sp. UNC451MF]